MSSVEASAEVYPYSGRNGVNTPQELEVLFADPEFRLSDDERAKVYEFTNGLATGVLGGLGCEVVDARTGKPTDLETLKMMSALKDQLEFCAAYFETPQGQADAAALCLTPEDDFMSTLRRGIATGEIQNNKQVRKAAADSRKWRTDQAAEQLARPDETDTDFVDPGTEYLNFDPTLLLDKFASTASYRTFYKNVYKELSKEDDSNLKRAKEEELRQHMIYVNYQMGLLYPSMCHLAAQLRSNPPGGQTRGWKAEIARIAPVIKGMFDPSRQDEDVEASSTRFARRMDLFKYGAVHVEDGQDFSAVSRQARELKAKLAEPAEAVQLQSEINSEIIRDMEQTTWNASQLKTFLEAALDERQLLSAEQADWDELAARQGKASDNKWQVVITPNVTSLTVSDRSKTVQVPEDFECSLLQESPAGALVVSAHELAHVLQAEYREARGRESALDRIGSRRAVAVREMGGIFEEKAFLALLGRKRPSNLYYLRGMEAKEAGANIVQVARAIMDVPTDEPGSQQAHPDLRTRRKRVNMALRFNRAGGYHSQPMDYVEQRIMAEALDGRPLEQLRALGTAATNFALMDSAALHRVDMFEVPESLGIESTADQVLRLYLERFHGASTGKKEAGA